MTAALAAFAIGAVVWTVAAVVNTRALLRAPASLPTGPWVVGNLCSILFTVLAAYCIHRVLG